MKNRCLALLLSTLLLAGCAPSGPAASSAPAEGKGASGVQVDWSRLEERTGRLPDTDGGRWYPDRTDRLIPGPDYGLLVPYVGGQAYSFNRWEREGEVQEYFSDWPTALYGLMTREGKIVVDPVYQHVTPYTCRQGGEDLALPVLLLARVDEAWKDSNSGLRYAVAAEDGSWMTDFAFVSYTNREDRLFLLRPEGCTVLDSATGARQDWSWAELGVSEDEVPEMLTFVQHVTGLTWLEQGVCLGQRADEDSDGSWENAQARIFQPDTGEIFWVEQSQWDQWCGEDADRRWSVCEDGVWENGTMTITVNGRSYSLRDVPEGFWLYLRQGDLAILEGQSGGEDRHYLYRLSTGERLLEGRYINLTVDPLRPDSFCAAVLAGGWTVYDSELLPIVTLPPSGTNNWFYFNLRDGILSFHDDSSCFACWNVETRKMIFYRNLGLGD